MIRIARWEIVISLVAVLVLGLAMGAVASSRWIRYEGHPELVIRRSCLAAEDSAAHLRLRTYEPGRITYGCYHTGY